MAYTNAEGRADLLAALGAATEHLGVAMARLGDAYDQLDERAGDRMEAGLFRPVQHAYGRAQRTYAEFVERYTLEPRTFEQPGPGRAAGARPALEAAMSAVTAADGALAELQDSMLPVEVGDAQVRAGISETRELLGPLPGQARELLRTLGR
ncbi:MAG TPA: hypothetical protein VFT50_01745 [Baekduia sp.]|nr:hypothetical protein [Baekduia sp.]